MLHSGETAARLKVLDLHGIDDATAFDGLQGLFSLETVRAGSGSFTDACVVNFIKPGRNLKELVLSYCKALRASLWKTAIRLFRIARS